MQSLARIRCGPLCGRNQLLKYAQLYNECSLRVYDKATSIVLMIGVDVEFGRRLVRRCSWCDVDGTCFELVRVLLSLFVRFLRHGGEWRAGVRHGSLVVASADVLYGSCVKSESQTGNRFERFAIRVTISCD